MNRIFRITLILSIFTINSPAQENYFSADNIYDFAEYLVLEKEYVRAAGEYQRLLVIDNISFSKDSILYKIGSCYQLAKKYKMSNHYFQKLINLNKFSDITEKSYSHIAYNFLRSGYHNKSINYINENITNISLKNLKINMNIILGINYFYLRKWKNSYDHFLSLNRMNIQDSLSLQFLQLAKEANQFSYKSQLLAGIMSTVIPGSGKMYAGRFKDGLYSFILVGICTWQSYDGFSKKGIDSLKGWIYGGFGTFFYIGNIYGSAVSAKIYNDKIENNFIKKVELNFTWD